MTSDKMISSRIRIIGGKWRSRLITFPSINSVRPTLDRVRETVFNWLGTAVENAICLDLFAGTGALGFEALSRGANEVIFIEKHLPLVTALKNNAALLQATNCKIICGDFPKDTFLLPEIPFDIVFIDPPFGQQLVTTAAEWLEEGRYLKEGALIYVETEKNAKLSLPSYWSVVKAGHTSTLEYRIYSRSRLEVRDS